MTNNDFDYIKQRFDESPVNAPEQLNEEFVTEQIKNIEPLKEKKNHKKLIISVSIAAGIAILLVNAILITSIFGVFNNGSFSFGNLFNRGSNGIALTANIKSFANYEEIKNMLHNVFVYDNYFEYDESDGPVFGNDLGSINEASPPSLGSSGEAGGLNSTYTQVLGVDEADTIKTDGEYIYYMDTDRTISIIKTDNGKTQFITKVEKPITKEIAESYFSDFYIYNDKLIALISSRNP